MTIFKIGIASFLLAIFVSFGGLWVFQTYGVYHFDPTPQAPETLGLTGIKVVNFISEDGASVQAWVSPPAPGQPVVLSFYGNSSAIGSSMQRLLPLTADGTGLIMLHYRGAAGLGGHPSEENFARDGRALYDQLDQLIGQTIPQNRRVLHGFSLGAGVGSRLAAERPFAAVVLEASFPRGCEYYERRYFGIPFCALMWAERYDIIDRIGDITAPKLFVHGTEDRSIPLLWGQRLFEAAPEPKVFVVLPGAGHSDLTHHGLIPAIQAFLHDHIK